MDREVGGQEFLERTKNWRRYIRSGPGSGWTRVFGLNRELEEASIQSGPKSMGWHLWEWVENCFIFLNCTLN